jgi:hypothetical protein
MISEGTGTEVFHQMLHSADDENLLGDISNAVRENTRNTRNTPGMSKDAGLHVDKSLSHNPLFYVYVCYRETDTSAHGTSTPGSC